MLQMDFDLDLPLFTTVRTGKWETQYLKGFSITPFWNSLSPPYCQLLSTLPVGETVFFSAAFELSFPKAAIVASWSDFVIWRTRIETSILSLAESLFLVIYNSTPPRFANCQLASSQISICFRHESIHVMLRDTIRVKIKLLYLLSSLRLTTPTSWISPVMTVKVFVS